MRKFFLNSAMFTTCHASSKTLAARWLPGFRLQKPAQLLLLSSLLLSTSLIMPVSAQAQETRYVSDDLTTWTRRGPGDNYRVSGQLQAGEQVTLLQTDSTSGYAEVQDSKGRTLWLPQKELSQTPGFRIRVPQLEQQVKTLSQQLANIEQDWNQRTADMQKKVAQSDGIIRQLQQQNQQLTSELTVANKKVDAANLQLDDKQRAIIMQWFMYGGGVLAAGLVLGLLLPHLIPRRKAKDRWMR